MSVLKERARGYSTPFVGRKAELASLATRLTDPDCRLLTITGLGGCGKTRLAQEVAAAEAGHFADGATFVALQSIPRADLILSAIAQSLGLVFYGDASFEQLAGFLSAKAMLLVLDNFEHLLDGAALVSDLLAAAPGLTVLATSREPLHLQEEWLFPLGGLSAPLSVYSSALMEYEAVQLFLAHARRVQPSFDAQSENEAVIQICMMTGGLPLALELAASWLKGLHASHIAQAMRHNLDLLSTNMRNIEPRHRSMRAVFDHSWELLSERERQIFAWLSVFRGGFASAAAEQVAGATLADLAGLVEKSLLQLDATGRFGIHELLRQYGTMQLATRQETDAAFAAHSGFYATLMRHHEASLKSPQQLETMQAIELDFENYRQGWEWALAKQHSANLHTMMHGLYLFGFLGSRHVDTIHMFQQTLAQPIADERLLGRLLARRWGSLHWWFQAETDYREAFAAIERALAIARAASDDFETAFCHLMAGYALGGMGRRAEVAPHLEASRALFEKLGEPYYVAWALSRLGYLYAVLNDPDKEIVYTEQSLAIARTMHNRFVLFTCLYNLGSDYILNGDYSTGKQYGPEVLQFATETGQICQISHAWSLLALQAFCEGDYSACQEYSDQSVKVIEEIILVVVQPYSLALLTLLACLREDYAEATRINDFSKHHSVNTMAFQLHHWASAALACGLGNLEEARSAIRKGLESIGSNLTATSSIWMVPCAAAVLAAGKPARAVELLAWALGNPTPALNWARQWPLLGRLQAQLEAALDHDTFAAHWGRGAALTLEDVTAELHREFGAAPLPAQAHSYLLTSREREILLLLAAGKTNPQIADQLIIGAGTVKTHTLNIYRKLEVANRTQAIVRARELHLLAA